MRLLKIGDDHEAFFRKDEDWASVTAIERDDLVILIDAVAGENQIELDECTQERFIVNPTAKLIYENLYTTLKDLVENRDECLKQYKEDFKTLKTRYGLEQDDESFATTDATIQ